MGIIFRAEFKTMGRIRLAVVALVLALIETSAAAAASAFDTTSRFGEDVEAKVKQDVLLRTDGGSNLKNLPLLNAFSRSKPLEQPDYDVNDVGEPLILTDYIENNRLEEARAAAKVQNDRLNHVAESYTGYFTVNKEYNSNLYFWYVPVKSNVSNAPLMLWLQGGPGGSSLFGLFVESGPFQVVKLDEDIYDVTDRQVTWSDSYNMIYFDQPAGTGFSFTDNQKGYAKNMDDVSKDLYEALRQFFIVFPELLDSDFYVAGESYAGKYVPAISHKIHLMNQAGAEPKIPLKGLAVGDGLCDPMHQWEYGNYAYESGLVSAIDRDMLHFMAAQAKKHIVDGDLFAAVQAFNNMNGFLVEKSGLSFEYNHQLDGQPADFVYYESFLVEPETRKGIHVGNQKYSNVSMDVYINLYLDFARSVVPLVQDLLNNDYKVMIYSGAVDVIITSTGSENFVNHLNWKCQDTYSVTDRNIWRYDGKVAGYAREVANLKQVLVRNAGHILPYDVPEVAFDMMKRFVEGRSFGGGPVQKC